MEAIKIIRNALLERNLKVKDNRRGGIVAQCPAHDDHSPSLSVNIGETQAALIYCYSGCDPEDVLAALNLTWKDILPPKDQERIEKRSATPFSLTPTEAIIASQHLILVIGMGAAEIAKNGKLSDRNKIDFDKALSHLRIIHSYVSHLTKLMSPEKRNESISKSLNSIDQILANG